MAYVSDQPDTEQTLKFDQSDMIQVCFSESVIQCYKHQENKSMKRYPLEPHFYVVKLGFTGVYQFFLFMLQIIDCGYSLELPR